MLSLCHLELCQTQWSYLRNSRASLLASQGSPQAPPPGSAWRYEAMLSLLRFRSAGRTACSSPRAVPTLFAGRSLYNSSSVTSPLHGLLRPCLRVEVPAYERWLASVLALRHMRAGARSGAHAMPCDPWDALPPHRTSQAPRAG